MSEILLEARNISKRFGGRQVIEDVSLSLHRGQILTVIGPNGSGKTTLVRLLLGLEKPDAGEVFRQPGLKVGYMPQRLVIDRTLPVSIRWFLSLHPHRHKPDEAKLKAVCEEVGIPSYLLGARMQDVSGGETQRLMLARTLLCSPQLLALDEPVQGVDVAGQAQLYALIARVARQRALTVLMVSHDLHLVMSATDEVVCLNRHVCCAGHPHAVRQDPGFINLFGPQAAESMAIYTHHHDHGH